MLLLLFVTLLIVIVSYQVWMPQILLARFEKAFEVSETGEVVVADTAAQRLEIWKAGLRTIPDHPLGVGLGLFPIVVPTYGLEEVLVNPVLNAHNEIVLITVELGVLGLILYLWLLGGLGFEAWRAFRADQDRLIRGMACGAMVGLVAALAASTAVNLVVTLDISGVLWLLLGMSARRAAEIKREQAFGTHLTRRGGSRYAARTT